MKTIGLLGGMSWESTLEYYKALNQGVREKLGGLHSAKIVLHSVDFGLIEALMQKGQWDTIGNMLGDAVVAQKMSERLLELGIYAIGFFYPVVPQGKARIRVQISAGHTKDDLDKAVAAFAAAQGEIAA